MRTHVPDLSNIVNGLLAAGFSQEALARQVDCSQGTICRLRQPGADCHYSTGKALEQLYLEHVSDSGCVVH